MDRRKSATLISGTGFEHGKSLHASRPVARLISGRLWTRFPPPRCVTHAPAIATRVAKLDATPRCRSTRALGIAPCSDDMVANANVALVLLLSCVNPWLVNLPDMGVTSCYRLAFALRWL
jgi:hypothetical protein